MNLELTNKTALVPSSTKDMATGTVGTAVSNGDAYFPETFLGDACE
jgi:hypothetical protein